jgi:hypothetical protein
MSRQDAELADFDPDIFDAGNDAPCVPRGAEGVRLDGLTDDFFV